MGECQALGHAAGGRWAAEQSFQGPNPYKRITKAPCEFDTKMLLLMLTARAHGLKSL